MPSTKPRLVTYLGPAEKALLELAKVRIKSDTGLKPDTAPLLAACVRCYLAYLDRIPRKLNHDELYWKSMDEIRAVAEAQAPYGTSSEALALAEKIKADGEKNAQIKGVIGHLKATEKSPGASSASAQASARARKNARR